MKEITAKNPSELWKVEIQDIFESLKKKFNDGELELKIERFSFSIIRRLNKVEFIYDERREKFSMTLFYGHFGIEMIQGINQNALKQYRFKFLDLTKFNDENFLSHLKEFLVNSRVSMFFLEERFF